ncbi:DUF3105 domain-containing protein [Candidatus Azambacteria bacterium]|nr:DUF3105 domain-containing protein [Candidatus Azambacteria bacterium]MBI3685242.1 DUF3105 domain-containing protein [Candidatus Azambacteria bacterium]
MRRNTLKIIGGIVIAAVIGIGLVWRFVPKSGTPKECVNINEGIFIADGGNKHVELGDDHPPYNSNPPTSGWHTPYTAKWGVSNDPIPNEIQTHNLEHGGIAIQYKQGISNETKQKLEEIVKRYTSKVLMAPRESLDRNIALTAWTYLDKMDEFDECRIVGFINAHINKGPEFTPD